MIIQAKESEVWARLVLVIVVVIGLSLLAF